MAICILENLATVIELVPPERPASATLSFKTKDGAELSTPSCTLDTTSKVVGEVVTKSELVLDSHVGVEPGRQYWLDRNDGAGGSLVRCAESWSADDRIALEAPPALSEVMVGDVLLGARLTATIPAVAERGKHHRAEWTVLGADGVTRKYQQTVHVCRTLFRPPVLADEAARHVAANFPEWGVDKPYGWFAEVARRASLRIERELHKGERFADLVGDFDVFVDAGVVALQLELATEGLYAPGETLEGYKARKLIELGEAVEAAMALTWYDSNDDEVVDEPGEVAGLMSYELERR